MNDLDRTSPLKIILTGQLRATLTNEILAISPGAQIVICTVEEIATHAFDAQVIATNILSDAALARARNLQWVHSWAAGPDTLMSDKILQSPVRVTCCKGNGAKRFLTRLIAQFGLPRVVITDTLRRDIWPIAQQTHGADHRAHKGRNNRIEGSHRSTRRREKIIDRFTSPGKAQRFLAAHDQINTIFKPRRYRLTATPGQMHSACGQTMSPKSNHDLPNVENLSIGSTTWQCRSST